MVRTKDAIRNWVNLMVSGECCGSCRANSCTALGYYFVSYNTPIAKFCGDHFEVSKRKYSCTTSKHQTYLRHSIPSNMLVEVDEVKDNGEFAYRW